MRPAPSPKHISSIVILVAASLLVGYFSWNDDAITDEQVNFLTAFRANDANFAGDGLYDKHIAGGQFRHVYSRGFTAFIRAIEKICPENSSPEMPLRLLVGPVTLLFLLGMYALLWRQTMSSATSTFVAILSATMMKTFDGWHWGVGALSSITPEGLVVAVSPLIILAYIKYFNDRRIVLVFLLMGLCGNIDLVSAMNLGLVTLLTFLACHKFNRQAVAVGISSIFLFVVGALPNISNLMLIHAHVAQAIGHAAPPDFPSLMQAFDMSYYEVTYPDLLVPLWQWGLYPLALAAVSLVVLWRLDKFRSQFIDLWVWMSVAALIVMLVFHAIAMGLAAIFPHRVLPFYVFLQAACWLMLPLYVLFARAITQVFRMLEKKHRHILRWVMAGIMIGWMLPSDAFRHLRYGMYSAAAITPIGQNSLKINDIIERKARRRELANIAQWQRKNCVNSFVYIDSPKYRLNSGQSVLTCREDFIYYYLFAPAKLTQWMDNLQKDHALLATLSVPELVNDAISRTKTSPQISEMFLVTSNKEVAANPQNLQEIKSDDWGKYWKIFRIPLNPVK